MVFTVKTKTAICMNIIHYNLNIAQLKSNYPQLLLSTVGSKLCDKLPNTIVNQRLFRVLFYFTLEKLLRIILSNINCNK